MSNSGTEISVMMGNQYCTVSFRGFRCPGKYSGAPVPFCAVGWRYISVCFDSNLVRSVLLCSSQEARYRKSRKFGDIGSQQGRQRAAGFRDRGVAVCGSYGFNMVNVTESVMAYKRDSMVRS